MANPKNLETRIDFSAEEDANSCNGLITLFSPEGDVQTVDTMLLERKQY